MLETFQSLREELTTKKQTEVDQTSVSASKPGTSSRAVVNLDLPPLDLELPFRPRIWMWTMVQHFLHVSDLILIMHRIRILRHPRNLLRRSRDKPKKHCHSHSRHEVEPRSASDQFNDESDEPRIPSTKPKKC